MFNTFSTYMHILNSIQNFCTIYIILNRLYKKCKFLKDALGKGRIFGEESLTHTICLPQEEHGGLSWTPGRGVSAPISLAIGVKGRGDVALPPIACEVVEKYLAVEDPRYNRKS